jgi:hypothetical protein
MTNWTEGSVQFTANQVPSCQPGTSVHMVHCELYLHVALGHMIPILVEYIIALHSSLNTTAFFSLSCLPCPSTTDNSERHRMYWNVQCSGIGPIMGITDVPGDIRGARLTTLSHPHLTPRPISLPDCLFHQVDANDILPIRSSLNTRMQLLEYLVFGFLVLSFPLRRQLMTNPMCPVNLAPFD